MLCHKELGDPRKCLAEGRAVTACALEFFRKVKKTCYAEFTQYANCLDKSSGDLHYMQWVDLLVMKLCKLINANLFSCRTTQGVYDKCMVDNMKLERPDYGYFCRAKVHHTDRPEPPKEKKIIYSDTPASLPDDYARPPAKYGSRFHWMH